MAEGVSPDEPWCPLGSQLAVDTDGGAYPCPSLMLPAFRVGSIHDSRLSSILRSEGMEKFNVILKTRKSKIEQCMNCSWQNLCQGGCMAMAYDRNRSFFSTDEFCAYRMKAYAKAFDRILDN